MARPLARYVTLTYAKYFVPLLVTFAVVSLPVELNFRIAYVMILPLAAVNVLALGCTLRLLSSKGELETMQAYGVPNRVVERPLAVATCAPLAVFSAAAIPLSSDLGGALLSGAVGLLVTITIPLVVVRRCWRRR